MSTHVVVRSRRTLVRDTLLREVFSLEQFLRMPEIKPALEFIGGRIVQKVSPNIQHSRIGAKLPARIDASAEPEGRGASFVELRCSFDGESYVPDLSFFTTDRLPLDEDGRLIETYRIAPDWSVEILSSGQTVAALTKRLNRLIAKGVRLGWLIQPRKSRVIVFRPDHAPRELHLGDVLDGGDVLAGFALPLDELFGWLVFPRPAR